MGFMTAFTRWKLLTIFIMLKQFLLCNSFVLKHRLNLSTPRICLFNRSTFAAVLLWCASWICSFTTDFCLINRSTFAAVLLWCASWIYSFTTDLGCWYIFFLLFDLICSGFYCTSNSVTHSNATNSFGVRVESSPHWWQFHFHARLVLLVCTKIKQ